jgi:hypothetical protein
MPGRPAQSGSGCGASCPTSWPLPESNPTTWTWSCSLICTWTTLAGTWLGTATRPGRGSRRLATWSSGPTGTCLPPRVTRTTVRPSSGASARCRHSGQSNYSTATACLVRSSRWCTHPGTPRARRACSSAPGDNAALFWGDVANHPAQVSEPLWCPASDVLPEQARRTRKALLDQIHADRMWLAPAHFPEPFGSVVQEDGERCWSPHAPQHPGCCVSPLLGQEE